MERIINQLLQLVHFLPLWQKDHQETRNFPPRWQRGHQEADVFLLVPQMVQWRLDQEVPELDLVV